VGAAKVVLGGARGARSGWWLVLGEGKEETHPDTFCDVVLQYDSRRWRLILTPFPSPAYQPGTSWEPHIE